MAVYGTIKVRLLSAIGNWFFSSLMDRVFLVRKRNSS